MEVSPAPGIYPEIDRFLNGYEGYSVFVNPLGVEVLQSAKGIPVAGWYLAASLPSAEVASLRHWLIRQQRWLVCPKKTNTRNPFSFADTTKSVS